MSHEQYKDLGIIYDPKTVEAPTTGVYNYKDGVVPFLRLRVTPKCRTWHFQKGWNRQHLKRKIGNVSTMSLDEARLRAFEWQRQLADGEVPPTVKQRAQKTEMQMLTVADLFERYFDGHVQLHCKTKHEIRWAYGKYWQTMMRLQVPSLQPMTVRAWMRRLFETSGSGVANKQYFILRAAINWGKNCGMVSLAVNPFLGIKPFPAKQRMEYLKPGDEMIRLRAALAPEGDDIQDIVWLLLFTGQRKSNVLSMRWDEIDGENLVWHIPPNKTKSKRQYNVGLTPKAMDILTRRQRLSKSLWVFPTPRASKSPHLTSINKAWERIRKRAQLDHLCIHSLRHSAASWLGLRGASAMVIKEALQHSSISTSQRYVHLGANDVRSFMQDAQEEMAG